MASFIVTLFSFYLVGYLIKTFSKINMSESLNYNLIAPNYINYGESKEKFITNKPEKQKLFISLLKDKPLLKILSKKQPKIKINLKGNFSRTVELT
jgi:hypothetical protein